MTGVGSQCLFDFTSVQLGLYVTSAKAKKQSARRQMTSAQEKTGSGYVARLNTVSVLFLLACLVLVSKVEILQVLKFLLKCYIFPEFLDSSNLKTMHSYLT